MGVVKAVSFVSLVSFLIGGWVSYKNTESPISQASHSIYAEPLDIEVTYDEKIPEARQENNVVEKKDAEHKEEKKKQPTTSKDLNHLKNLKFRRKMDIVLGKNGAKIFRKLSKEGFRNS